jgi:hypothetical protein
MALAVVLVADLLGDLRAHPLRTSVRGVDIVDVDCEDNPVRASRRGVSSKELVRGLHESDVQRPIFRGHELQVPVMELNADDEIE